MRDILENLPLLEFRRQYPMHVIASLIAPSVGVKNASLLDWFPEWAKPAGDRRFSESIHADLRVGVRLGLVSQDLLDFLED